MQNNSTLYYVTDPMCSWCYAFRPTWLKVLRQLPPDITVKYIMGGLAPDSDEPMPAATQQYVQAAWHKIIQSVPGTEFNFDFWTQCRPRRSTYIACRAVIVARRENRHEAMLSAIQDAYYRNAQNPSEAETLYSLAKQIGMNETAFRDALNSPDTQAELLADIQFARSIGGNSFPSLFFSSGGDIKGVPVNFSDAQQIITLLR